MWTLKPLISIVFVLAVGGCTRGKTDNSSVTFSLPQRASKAATVGAKLVPLGTATMPTPGSDDPVLAHVVINISGSGISPAILKSWDANNGNSGACTPNADLSLTCSVDSVPSGSSRLIQVLAVYQTPISQSMQIFYGDVSQDLVATTETPVVTVASVSGSSTSMNGNIFGRWLTAGDSGPTADINVKYQPPGKPAMIVQRSTMFNGWFTIFALSNANFVYELQPGAMQATAQPLFGGAVNLHSSIFDPNENSGAEWYRRSAAFIPYHLRSQGGSNGTVSWSPESAQIYVWGFWGNDTAKASSLWSTRVVCRDSLSGSLSQLTKFTPALANQASQPGLQISNLINIGLAVPTDSVLLDATGTLAASGYITFDGGDTSCPPTGHVAANQYVDWFKVSQAMVDGHGNDGAAGFRGPFKVDANLNPFSVTTGSPRVLSADVLPGVQSSIDEVRLYKKTNVGFNYHQDSPDCSYMPTSDYALAGSGTLDATGHLSLTTNVTTAEATTGVAGVVCTYKNGTAYAGGLSVDPWYFNQSGNGGVPATKLAISFLNDTSASPQIHNGVCVPLVINGADSSGNPAMLPMNVQIAAVTPSAMDTFSQHADCSSPFAAGATLFPAYGTNTGAMVVYYRSERTGGNPGVNFTLGATGLTPTQFTFNTSDQPGTATYVRLTHVPTSIYAFGCYPIDMYTAYAAADTMATNMTTSTSANVLLTSADTNVSFYQDSQCTMSTSAITLGWLSGYSTTNQTRYFSYRSTTVPGTPPTITASNFTPLTGADSVTITNVNQPGAPTGFQMAMNNQMSAGGCYPVSLQLVDSNHHPTPLTSAFSASTLTISLNAAGLGTFYQDPTCSSVSTSSVTMSPGSNQTTVTFSFKPTAAGTGTIGFNATGASTLTASMQVTITPEVASKVVYVFPGQTWTSGNSSYTNPSPSPVLYGVPVPVVVYAVLASNNQVDTTYNSAMGLSLNTSAFTVTGDAAVFVSGHKTISVTFTPSAGTNFGFGNATNFMNQFGGLQIPTSMSSPLYIQLASPPTAAQVVNVFQAGGSMPSVYTGSCQPISIQTGASSFSGGGYTYTPAFIAGSGAPVNTSSQTGTTIYSDSACTTSVQSAALMNGTSDSQAILYAKYPTVGSNYGTLNTIGPGPYPGFGAHGNGVSSPAPGAISQYVFIGASGMLTGMCQPYLIGAFDANFNSIATTATVTLSSSGGGAFYSDATCATASSTVNLSSSRAAKIYYKTSNPSSGQMMNNFSATDGTVSGTMAVSILHYQ